MARRRGFSFAPAGELAGHLHREVEIVEGYLLDVDPERDRGTGLGRGRAEMGPEPLRDLDGRPPEDLALRGEQGLLGPRGDGRPEPRDELEALGRTAFSVGADHGRHRFRFEQDLGREEVAPGPRLLDETVDLVLPVRDRDVPEGYVLAVLRDGTQDAIRLEHGRSRIVDSASRT